jgi:hypothetical protein
MAHYSETRIETVCVGDLVSNARSKVAAVTADGKVLRVSWAHANAPLRCPFSYGTYDGSDQPRVNLSFEVTPDLCAWITAFEELLVRQVANRSSHFFKAELPYAEVHRAFTSSLKEGVTPTVRTKMNVSGHRAVRVWDKDNNRIALPGDMRGLMACPLVEMKNVWFNAGRWGAIWELTDLRIEEQQLSSPWQNA